MPKIKHVIPENIATLLRAAFIDGNVLRKITTQLDAATYKALNKTLEHAGGKWSRSAQGHVFPAGGIRTLLASLDAGESTDHIAEHQFFPTPPEIASDIAMHAMMGRKSRQRVLEPSAGDGVLARAVKRLDGTSEIMCVEIRPEACLDLRRTGQFDVRQGDFLGMSPAFLGDFDVIVMNPPFTKDADIRHILHAWTFLRPGGKLVSLCSPGFTFSMRGLKKTLNELLFDREGDHRILPRAQFGRTELEVAMIQLEKPAAVAAPAPLRPLQNGAARRLAAM